MAVEPEFSFLLRFLRTRKFSQLGARQTLENYWKQRTKSPAWFRDVDPNEEIIVEIIKTGFYLIPKTRDKHGRRVIIDSWSKFDTTTAKKRWGIDNIFRATCLICDLLIRDENVQANGIIVVNDNTNVTLGHLTLMGQENSKKIMEFYQNSLPARMKGLHFYNEPAFFDAMFALFGPLMTMKNKERMHLHGRSLVAIYEELGMECLPVEYLPDNYKGPNAGTIQEIINKTLADLQSPEFCTYIKELSSDKYGVDLDLLKQNDAPVASFRKLNVD
ncbi:alpha-tocopherol transfer protein-like isoform X2 [Dreissena polymorpha]|uniref:alpha-tocopherol transfer protein-like isoform X2 n=1 Tax=Dreissena polymorpha TaxID=45954 RepID=UPI0022653AB3|nr:alpha-tocopherol transfer protein-like isoform X2 [Dreissena polymorpha]